jgi:predicted DNA-binding protein with PD1-like motif
MVPVCIEQFCEENKVSVAQVILLGGLNEGEIVSGPRRTDEMPPDSLLLPLDGAHEVAAVGIVAPDESGKPVLHIHGSLGRAGHTMMGCLRPGVRTWLIAEALIVEITGTKAVRKKDKASGFTLMEID